MKLTAYNPGVLARDETVKGFVARQGMLARAIEELRKGKPQHRIFVGQRGMGKSSLLRRLYFAVLEDPAIAKHWVPVAFREEQYNVASLGDFWLNCLEALDEASRPDGSLPTGTTVLEQALDRLASTPRAQLEREAWRVLEAEMRTHQRGLCLLVDNVDLIFDRLSQDECWKLRETLSEKSLLLIGGSVAPHPATFTYDAPFYDFFRTETLVGLDDAEVRALLRSLSALRNTPDVVRVMTEDPGRITTLRILSGGNPRAVVLVHQLLATRPEHTIIDDITALLDMCTPLYKARLEALSAQAQIVFDAVCRAWDPVTAARVASDTRLDVNAVSSQLSRLVAEGVLEQVRYPGSRKAFQVAERLFNVWCLMRMGGRARRKLLWLVEFLRAFYGPERISEYAKTLAKSGARDADVLLAYATAADDAFTKRSLELQALEAIIAQSEEPRRALAEALDLKGADRHLASKAERLIRIREIKRLLARQPALEDGMPIGEAVLGMVEFPSDVRYSIAAGLVSPTRSDALRRFVARYRGIQRVPLTPLLRAIIEGRVESLFELRTTDLEALRDSDRPAFEEGLCHMILQAESEESILALRPLLTESEDDVTWAAWLESAFKLSGAPAIVETLSSPSADHLPSKLWFVVSLTLQGRCSPASLWVGQHMLDVATRERSNLIGPALLAAGTLRTSPRIGGVFSLANLGALPWEDVKRDLVADDIWNPSAVRFLARFATQAGYAQQAAELMDEKGLSNTHRPVREALLAAARGPEHLLTVAPEVREPAQKILAWITFVKPPRLERDAAPPASSEPTQERQQQVRRSAASPRKRTPRRSRQRPAR
jgi:hypothetical protein